ncbi:peptidoglycan amidohydrolase family protein [Vagococcus fluvialis]|uniref:peptidoglycan amidohydrolase family protein n=1 Tax=Vagococcus fluvialis TaxID=2738 RepID=UPI001A8FF38F|nr:peptidoglycan amidohydrolase family protein [Vagococcus fluvialis]MBO0486057.1 SH3 domain-containing protein [Vagococcus fluvialis]
MVKINIETSIGFMDGLRQRGIRYSMTGARDGSDGTGDCSGTIVRSVEKAGASKPAWLYNTDSMHAWLVQNGYKLIADNKEWTAKRGDIVIFGGKRDANGNFGGSGGAAGHVVEFISNTQIIHCTYKNPQMNGVYVDNEATTCPYFMGWYVYRNDNIDTSKPIEVPNTERPDKVGWYMEEGTFHSYLNNDEPIAILDKAVDGKVIGWLPQGKKAKYDQFTHKGGYVWIRQPRADGSFGFLATGKSDGKKRLDYWGDFK